MKPKAPKKKDTKPSAKSGIQKVSISEFDNGLKIDLSDPSTKKIIIWYKKRKD